MKITSIETFAVQAKPIDKKSYWGSRGWGSENRSPELSTEYPPPLRRRFIYSKTIDTVIVKLTTDDGLVGWGEAKAPVAPQATKQIIDLLPIENCSRTRNQQYLSPPLGDFRIKNPKQSITIRKSRPFRVPLRHRQLLAQRHVLQNQIPSASKAGYYRFCDQFHPESHGRSRYQRNS